MIDTRHLTPVLATPESFAPFGQVILPSADGTPFGPADAQLDLGQGTPRCYVMRLQHRGFGFTRITRHARVTQCLGAMMGVEWLLAVAPPDAARAAPDPAAIRAFRIPGDRFVKLHAGTWHAGPYFAAATADFLNLELADTNETDHDTCRLDQAFGLDFAFAH